MYEIESRGPFKLSFLKYTRDYPQAVHIQSDSAINIEDIESKEWLLLPGKTDLFEGMCIGKIKIWNTWDADKRIIENYPNNINMKIVKESKNSLLFNCIDKDPDILDSLVFRFELL